MSIIEIYITKSASDIILLDDEALKSLIHIEFIKKSYHIDVKEIKSP